MPEFFDRYILLVDDISVMTALTETQDLIPPRLRPDYERLQNSRYAPDKWTIKEVLQHVIDNERIQTYRALRFARRDNTPLPGYDEVLFASHAETAHRTLESLEEEFTAVRKSTLALYRSFTPEMLQEEGICFNKSISVLALGFQVVGHQLHHQRVIAERYFHRK